MRARDIFSGIFWLAFAVFVCAVSAALGIGTLRNPGSGFLPFWSGAALGTFSLLLVASKSLGRVREKTTGNLWRGMRWDKVIFVLVALLGYALLLDYLGYLIATFGMLAFLFGIIGGSRLWIRLVIALLTSVATYAVFDLWLGVELPAGLLGFFS